MLEIHTDAEQVQRAEARRLVSVAANEGRPPRAYWSQDDLDWAFEGHEEDLARLERVAASVREAQERRDAAQERRRALVDMTKRVLKEWDEQAERERHAEATAEAQRRLGLE